MSKKTIDAVALLLLFASACGHATPAADPKARTLRLPPKTSHAVVLRGARVFDGARVHVEGDVLLVDGTIGSIDAPARIDAGGAVFEEIDVTGCTILPGLIDAHVHAGDSDEALEQALVFGVTTAIDMFGPPARMRLLRAQELAGEPALGADLVGAGTLATAPGGHGTEYGLEIPTIARPEEAQAFVRARFSEGSDFLKIVLDTEVLVPEDAPPRSLPREVATALASAAHARGSVVVAHVGTRKDAEDAVAAGVDGLEHTFLDAPLDGALADAIAERGVTLTPTLSMVDMRCGLAAGEPLLGDARVAPLLSDSAKKRLRRTYRWAKPVGGSVETCRARAFASVRAVRGRAPILAGTDAPNGSTAFGASLHRELELLVAAGLTPLEALVAATSAPADAFRLSDRGRLAPGLRADVVVVDGDPTTDIGATRSIRAVYRRGAKIDRWALAARAGKSGG